MENMPYLAGKDGCYMQSAVALFAGLSQPFLGMGPEACRIGKNSVVSTKIGKKIQCFMKFLLSD